MKVIEFIKRNISVFNVFGFTVLSQIIYVFIIDGDNLGMGSVVVLAFFFASLLLLFIDYILRLLIKDRFVLFIIELVSLIMIISSIYSNYFK